jgi:hypothetical protein
VRLRFGRGLVVAIAGCAAPAQQAASAPASPPVPQWQTMTPPAMPFACDLDAAPVGSWAEYEHQHPWTGRSVTRIALVGRGPEGVRLEKTEWEGFVVQLSFAPGGGTHPRHTKTIIQDDEFDPMEIPLPTGPQSFYGRIEDRSLLGSEVVTVRAGTFTTNRYKYRTTYNETVEAWISETAWPICLVKLDAEQKQHPSEGGRFGYELVAMGDGAAPRITRPAVPYDIEVLKKRGAQKRARPPTPPPPP